VTQEIAGVRRDDLAAWHDRALHAARNEPKSSLGHALHKFEKHVSNTTQAQLKLPGCESTNLRGSQTMARTFEATTSRPHTSGVCLATSSHLNNKNMHACEHMAAETPNR